MNLLDIGVIAGLGQNAADIPPLACHFHTARCAKLLKT